MKPLRLLPDAYYTSFSQDLPVYNGRLYSGYASNIIGNAYLFDQAMYKGWVEYDSIAYNNLSLSYDIYAQHLIVYGQNNLANILYGERVSAFQLEDKSFLRLTIPGIAIGFYQLITKGEITLICKRQKTLKEKLDQMIIEREFLNADQFFVLKNGQVIPLSSKRALRKIIQEKKQLISRELRQRNIRFKSDKEKYITTAVQLYNGQN